MKSWLAPLRNILTSESSDLRSLALAVEANPDVFYVNQDLSRCNLKGQDLRGMDLTGTSISPQQMDKRTLIDPEFDPRFVFKQEYLSFRLSLELASLVLAFADERNYSYKAWAFKNLIEKTVNLLPDAAQSYEEFIDRNDRFRSLLEIRRGSYRIYRVQVYPNFQRIVHDWEYLRYGVRSADIYGKVILIGLLAWKMPDLTKRDYDLLAPLALYKNANDYYAQFMSLRR